MEGVHYSWVSVGVFQRFWTFSEEWGFSVINNLLSNLVNFPVLFSHEKHEYYGTQLIIVASAKW